MAGMVTEGLAEDSLPIPPGSWLTSSVGSAPDD